MIQKTRTEPYLSAYLHSRGVAMGIPVSGTFELTARCNFRCPMCYVHLNKPDAADRELTARQWIGLARQARDQGMLFLLLTGGEPFIRQDFFEIYSALKQMGLLISINTNGSLLYGETLNRLLEDPPFRVNISLYGGCGETYRQMCGQDAFDRVTTAIRTLRQAGVDIRLNLSITPYNRQDIEKIYAISRELDVHVKATAYMYPPVRLGEDYGTGNRLTVAQAVQATVAWDRLRLSPEEFALRQASLRRFKAPEPLECPVEPGGEGIRCRAGRASFWMTWDGRMQACGMLPSPGISALETGFQEAWQHILRETRAIRTPGKCAACPKRDVCSVCAAVCFTETGSFEQVPEYMCGMTDGIIAEASAEEI